ncbi:Creatinine amidohydrolase [Falsiruegeria litorea R37]|uniref:Creatinine amidohydrolase n=1 Tax=Falsiruegeria litorea R37 TaxID=1200284 RepID=A0A1Y5T996_9RHOB|nr:creatininase family protein [Falsiruegeria litorea]SLN58716.1 Creatinine amidohydrolase [Falsiruegeria litorea R37]
MKLEHMTWREVDNRIRKGAAIMLPVGSTEQHGPMGRIGTDTICAEAVALQAAEICNAIVAPPLAYTPAPFNTAFPGTVSMPVEIFQPHADAVISGLLDQGFLGVFVVNGHGANIAPLRNIAATREPEQMIIRSWWEPEEVNSLRRDLYGDWEGMHATPSEIAITQSLLGALPWDDACEPPTKLTKEYLLAHSGDRHGPPDEHREMFPDGRVGSHSALATPEDGSRILRTATQAIAREFLEFEQRSHGTFHLGDD